MADIETLLEDFSLLTEWEDRYAYIIELGEQLPPMDEALKTPASKVDGCVSQVWLVAEEKDGVFQFTVDSDAHIVRGLAAILMVLFDGKTAAEIAAVDADEVFGKLGLDQHLSPNRRSGLSAMVKRMKAVGHGY